MSHWTNNPIAYRRNLPHFTPEGATYFITFRLHGSLPKPILEQLQVEYRSVLTRKDLSQIEAAKLRKKYFAAFDRELDTAKEGDHFLKQPDVATALKNILENL